MKAQRPIAVNDSVMNRAHQVLINNRNDLKYFAAKPLLRVQPLPPHLNPPPQGGRRFFFRHDRRKFTLFAFAMYRPFPP
jgi:hypothetical protein